jgi:acyl carrier protein
VKRIVGEQTGMAPEKIRETHELINDLGCDSLDVTEIAIEAEDHFGISVPDEVAQHSRTVGDIVDGLLQLLAQPAAATR